MMKGKRLVVVLLALAFTIAAHSSYAQNETPRKEGKNNTLGVIFSVHEFFDGNPIIQPRTAGTLEWLNLSFGLEYARMLNKKDGLILSATWCGLRYVYVPPPRTRGDIAYRLTSFFDLSYQRTLFSIPRLSASLLGGINYRHGDELVLLYVYYREAVTHAYALRDIGLTAGVRGSFRLFWNIMVSGEVRFTQYIYRNARHHEDAFNFRNRTTGNMLTMQVGTGYQF